ncbi:TMEM175 family protein [Caulobacter sp. LARHSG274]
MSNTIAAGKEEQHLHRLVLFSDAVFAIAITLLAIEIHPPEGWNGQVGSFFHLMAAKLLSYAVTFATVGVLWISHRRTFSRLHRADGLLDVLNFLMLGLVALLPLGTQLLWEVHSSGPLVLYVGLVAAIGLTQGLIWIHAAFIGRLAEPMGIGVRLFILARVSLLPGLFCGLSFLSLGTGTPWGFLAIGVIMLGLALIGRRLQPVTA